MKVPSSELPVMKSHCKTCPFKPDGKGIWQDTQLANQVVSRTLFNSHQICHGTEDNNRKANNRCKGAFDHNFEIYSRMGFGELVK